MESLSDNDFCLQEKVNVKNEYRMILFYYQKPTIIKRQISNDGSWINGLSNGRNGELINSNDVFFWKK